MAEKSHILPLYTLLYFVRLYYSMMFGQNQTYVRNFL